MAFVQAKSASHVGNDSFNVVFASAVGANKLLAIVTDDGTGDTITAPSGFTQYATNADLTGPDSATIRAFWKDATGSEGTTFAWASSAGHVQVVMSEHSGRATGAPTFSAATQNTTSNATPVSASFTGVTAVANDDLVLLGAIDQTNQTDVWSVGTFPSGWTSRASVFPGDWGGAFLASKEAVSAGATGAITCTLTRTSGTGNTGYGGFVVRLPAAAGTTFNQTCSAATATAASKATVKIKHASVSAATATVSTRVNQPKPVRSAASTTSSTRVASGSRILLSSSPTAPVRVVKASSTKSATSATSAAWVRSSLFTKLCSATSVVGASILKQVGAIRTVAAATSTAAGVVRAAAVSRSASTATTGGGAKTTFAKRLAQAVTAATRTGSTFTVKNAIAKTWTITPSGDGKRYSDYPAGDKPGFNPIIVAVDCPSGNTSGGENNLGDCITLYGFNFGNFADYGNTSHVYINGVEVANYRCLDNAPGSGTAGFGNGVFETYGLKRLTFQVGGLGGASAGTAYNISMTVNGRSLGNPSVAGQYYDYLSGDALTFTPQAGPIIFVDGTNGSDSNPGTFALPKQHMQASGAIGGSGALRSGSSSTDTTGTPPGTHVYVMNGTYGSTGTLANGIHGCWGNFFRISGLAPSGGSNRGYIHIQSYPGAAGANARHTPSYDPGAGVSAGGGFIWNDQARAQEACAFDTSSIGWAKYITVSNLKIVAAPDAGSDSAPLNLDSRADYARIMGCELVWKTTVTDAINGTGAHARAGGIAGNGRTVRIGCNYIHDIWGDTAWNENHGTYFDGSVESANGIWFGFNVIKHITAGNGVQTYNGSAPDTIQNVFVHNNWIEDVNKNGLNISDNTSSRRDWSNVVKDCGEYSVYFSSASLTAANAQSVENNVLIGWGRVNSARPAIGNTGNTGSGSTRSRNNILYQPSGYSTSGGFVSLDSAGTNNLDHNRYFDANGVMTQPSADTTGTYGDPLFNSLTNKDYGLQSGSPCIDAAATTLATRNFDFMGRVISGTADIGAFEYGAHL